ncbi:thiol reductant ABC exporter subunit CydD [Frankia sp. Cj5]|uniref:thiol reductant ABC exporter subunit CydD n=1 Tax=Frankia sp. Cj5 TaxID=2880978 RepID=UPI001EF751B4|nr:thiol reductant ABC exporter subunit CydD [Frankia sp. Cj5]
MRPVDPRLLRTVPALRLYLVRFGVLAVASAVLVVIQATVLADLVLAGQEPPAGRGGGAGPSSGFGAGARAAAAALIAVVAARTVLLWVSERTAQRTAPAVSAELRAAMLGAVVEQLAVEQPAVEQPARGHRGGERDRDGGSGALAVIAGAGLDGMEAYLTRFLPALVMVVVVPPFVLIRIAGADLTSAVMLAVALPLVPAFMVLVGLATRSRTDQQWAVLGRLSGHFLDVVEGLATLKIFNRAKAQVEVIRRITDAYREQTMVALRWAFLSSFVLELLATLSVALVAVSVGLRLVSGSLDLRTGLLALLLAPEVYLPLRQVGMQYHATVSGLTAAGTALDAIDAAPTGAGAAVHTGADTGAGNSTGVAGRRPLPVPVRFDTLRLDGVRLRHAERVDLTIRRGEIVALVGPSGAGKSTLLALLRGALAPARGRVLVDGTDLADLDPAAWRARIAWLPQRPHAVCGGTVADEIRLGRPGATAAEITAALTAAGAPAADRVVGEDGGELSAGELRRVALARVLIRDAALVLLDEPGESLDAAAEEHVAMAVAALRGRATVVLVAHSDMLAGVADRVVTVSAGQVVDDRTVAPAPVRPRAARLAGSGTRLAGSGVVPAMLPAAAPGAVMGRPAAIQLRDRSVAVAPAVPLPGPPPASPRRAFMLFASAWRRLALGIIAGAAALGCGIGLTATSAWLIVRAAQRPPVLTLMVAVVAVRAFGLGRPVFRYVERLASHDAALRGLARLRAQVFTRLVPLAPAGLGTHRRGDLLRRFTADVDGVGESLLRGVGPTASAALACAGAVIGVGVLLPAAGAVLAVGLAVAALLAGPVTARYTRGTVTATALARARRDTEIVSLLEGLDEFVAFGAVRSRLARLRRRDQEIQRLVESWRGSPAWGAATGSLAAGLTLTAVSVVGLAAVHRATLSPVMLAVIVLTTIVAFEPLAGLTSAFAALADARHAAGRVFAVLDREPPVSEPVRPRPLPDGPLDVRMTGVHLRYGPDSPLVLDGFDLYLPAGGRVALVGASGVGKSSVVDLLLRFRDPQAGRVLVGGVDIRDVRTDELYRRVTGMTQDAHVFDATLRENLLIAHTGAVDAELTGVLARVGLADWVAGLPDGLATRVGADGERMSGGQRQRLLLARALLADPRVLVLDEPTAHLDPVTEAAVMRTILDVTRGRTLLLITHRTSGFDELDAVVELAGGTGRLTGGMSGLRSVA